MTARAPYGLRIEPGARGTFIITRYGRRYYLRALHSMSTARRRLRDAVEDCRRDPLSGVHFADEATRRLAKLGHAKIHGTA